MEYNLAKKLFEERKAIMAERLKNIIILMECGVPASKAIFYSIPQ